MDRHQKVNHPGRRPPPLSLVDTRRKTEQEEKRVLLRLAPLPLLAMLLSTFLATAFFLLGKVGVLATGSDYLSSFENFALRALVFHGLIPLVTASLMVAVYQPPSGLVAGARPSWALLLVSPAAGFFSGALVWSLLRLALTFFPTADKLLAVPQVWQAGALYLNRAPLIAALTLLVALIIPAGAGEFLFRGLIQPVFVAGRSGWIGPLLTALLAAILAFDPAGLAVLILGSILAAWGRAASGSLWVPSLLSAGYAGAMLFSGSLFDWLSRTVLKMPLIDLFRVRIFLVTLVALLILLLLVPLTLIGSAARRNKLAERPREKGSRPPFWLANRLTALLCLAAAALCLYFLS